jgi:16S rRNA (cytosine1402-N4)-methyltransferase
LEKQKQEKMHQNKNQNKNELHEPVLLEAVLKYLEPKKGESYLDLTAGYGGHARAVTARTERPDLSTLVDRDEEAVRILRDGFNGTGADVRHQDFLRATRGLLAENRKFDLILADLGVSSPHLNEGKRGFAIIKNGPLDMRMDRSQELTAETIVNSYSEADLSDLLRRYGEEPKAGRIAREIVRSRPLRTTGELAAIAAGAWPGRSRVHPATRTFQALRIAVNDELGQLEEALPLWPELLAPGGRIGVISFHSLEDRLVKQAFKELAGNRYDAELELPFKSPISASSSEIVFNPRARSAKLRVAVKIKKKGNADANSGKR